MATTDSRPVPIKNTAYRAVFPIYDADGDLVTGATGLDSEVSKDQGTFTDCTNEATEIATNSGMYYLDLTSTEMNADCVAVIVKTSSSGAKTTVLVFYPNETGDIDVDTTAYNGTAVTAPNTAGTPLVDVGRINGDATAAIILALINGKLPKTGTVDSTAFTPTATAFESDDITEATASHFLNRNVYPTSGVLQWQCVGVITAYTLTGGRGHFTVSPGSPSGEAMADNVTFVIL